MHEYIQGMDVPDVDAARRLLVVCARALGTINDEMDALRDSLSEESYRSARRALGWVMASEFNDFVHRLEQQHPALREEDLI